MSWFSYLFSLLILCSAFFDLVLLETTYEGPHYVEKGMEFNITCFTSPTKYIKWSRDGEEITKTDNNYLVVFQKVGNEQNVLNVKEADVIHAGKYKCNNFDDNYHQVVIITGLGNSNDTEIPTIPMDVGKQFVLECSPQTVPENSSLEIVWFKGSFQNDNFTRIINSTTHEVFSNSTLIIRNPTDEDAGMYRCQPNSTDGSLENNFIVPTRPRIKTQFPKSISHIQKDSLVLHCEALGNPTPEFSWYKDNEPINETRISITTKTNVSTLEIEHLEEDDRAEYTCAISNIGGKANTTILVRVKDKLAALWPFLGIVAEVGVLCTIIFIYEKRRAKQEFEESDTDQSPDTKNVADNKEKDVRQRK